MEGNIEKSALNSNLEVALQKWQKYPDGKEQMGRVQKFINEALKEAPLVLMINKDVLKNAKIGEGFIAPSVAQAYGGENGRLLEFDTSNGLRMRVSELGLLFLEKSGKDWRISGRG